MDSKKLIAIVCIAFISTLSIFTVRSCTEDALAHKKQSSAAKKTEEEYPTHEVSIQTGTHEQTEPVEYDLFGNPIVATTAENVEYDLFGNPITTAPPTTETTPAETDEEGNFIEEPTDEGENGETTTSGEDEPQDEPEEPVTTDLPRISGFNHNEYDDEGNIKPTLPPDFAIIIN